MKPILILVLAALAAGCSSPNTRWAKSGTSPEELRLDQDECAARGSSYDFALEDRDTGRTGIVESSADLSERRGGSARGDVYRRCMEDRGWRRERGGQRPQ
ncbi:MAG TPA: hypothetical protein VHM01_16915 [Alphaproteobacteria bacterium]|nr:hypothetical protein [Alphaproteobacteria bacterium]